MKKSVIILLSIILVLTMFLPVNAQDKVKGFAFLRIGTGGRAAGMGEAYTAVTEGAQATFWNPAFLKSNPGNSVIIAHTEWLEDISSNFLGFSFRKGKMNFGISLYSNTVSNIEKRSKPSVTPEGLFSSGDFYLGLSASYQIKENLCFGATVKYLYQKIYIEDASGYALDIGAGYKMLEETLSFGAVLKNIGSVNALKEEKTPLPSLLRVGTAYKFKNINNLQIIISTDLEKVFDGDSYTYFGSEIGYKGLLFIRSGYQGGYDARGVSYGIGVLIKKYHFDYGFQPFSYRMGNTHRISFYYTF